MKLLRYFFIQIFAYAIDLGTFLLLFSFNILAPIPANLCSKTLSAIFSYLANRSFTFKVERSKRRHVHAIRYLLLVAINVPFSSAILAFILLWIDWPIVAKLSTDFICVLVNYWLTGHYVFNTNNNNLVFVFIKKSP